MISDAAACSGAKYAASTNPGYAAVSSSSAVESRRELTGSDRFLEVL